MQTRQESVPAQSLLPAVASSPSTTYSVLSESVAQSAEPVVHGLDQVRGALNRHNAAVTSDIKPTINYAKQVVHHHHYSEEKSSKYQQEEDDDDEEQQEERVHIDKVSERELYPDGTKYKLPCLHCHQPVKRQYPPHPEAINTYYVVCSNACGRVVLHRHCASKIACDPKAEKYHLCDKCKGDFTVSPTLAVLQALYDTGKRIPFRKLGRYALYMFLLSYLLKLWWFFTIVVGYEPIDRVHNPALIKAKSVGLFDIFVYNFTVMDRVSQTWIGRVGRSIGAEFDPVAYRSYGLKPDAGQFWLTVRFLTFVAVVYFFTNALVMMCGLRVRGFFTYAEIKTTTGFLNEYATKNTAKGGGKKKSAFIPKNPGKDMPRNRFK